MEQVNSLGNSVRGSRRLGKWLIGFGILAAVGLSSWSLAIASDSSVACDVTTGASFVVLGVKTTLSQATLSWTEKRHSSQRYFCYGIGSPSKCALVSTRNSGTNNQIATGLTANTKYAYKFYGVYQGSTKSVVTGTFTTDASACGTSVVTTVEVGGTALSATGDSLEHVVAVVSNKSSGAVVGRDTTDRSGFFQFAVDPGTYLITLNYPPFSAPIPYTAVVVTGKPLTIPNQIMTGSFLVEGTVITSDKGDSVVGAAVKILNKTDNSLVASLLTDFQGHFSVGLKSGDYLLSVTYIGKSLNPPLTLAVGKSVVLPKIILPMTSSIRAEINRWRGKTGSIPGLDYDVRGARIPDGPAHGIDFFRITK